MSCHSSNAGGGERAGDGPAHAGRYARQEILKQIGIGGQERLSKARVLLVGCGALGCAAADLLVRAGVGFLRIVDRDLVEISNLQRQLLFDEKDAAEQIPKAVAAGRRLGEINSAVFVEPIVADANAGNIERLAERVNLIVDGTDNVATRYLLNDLAVKNGVPWIYGACVGTGGRVMAVWPGKKACLRCVFPQPPAASELPTCDVAGILGPAAGVIGAMQASQAIRVIVEGNAADVGGLISLDVWNAEMRKMDSAKSPAVDCPCCGRREFPFLSHANGDFTTTLCGRNTIQVQMRQGSVDLSAAAKKLAGVGTVQTSPWFIRCQLRDPAGIELTLFPDSRLLVKGTSDPLRAKSVYSRFVGS